MTSAEARSDSAALDGSPQTSTRDRDRVAAQFAAWLTPRVASDTTPEVTRVAVSNSAGFSSETVLVDVAWTAAGEPHRGSYVVRLPPPADAFPLFPWYDLDRQGGAMRFVAARSAVPVPAVPWYEPSGASLGAPFLVMECIEGVAVPDMPPYVFGSWLSEADVGDQVAVESAMVEILAGIHECTANTDELAFLELDRPGESALERHVAQQRAYFEWMRGDMELPLIERAFAWLDAHWPAHEGESRISWGDARPANVLWRDFRPVAVLDWEAVATGPRELDLAWLVFFHEYFQRFAEVAGVTGMPTFLQQGDVIERYEALTDYAVRDFEWYLVYAELRQALTSIRVCSRQVHFGERPPPSDPEELIMQRDHLAAVVDGSS
jgi:aminoglycoside phosphotransferase (APT) family kinase protein